MSQIASAYSLSSEEIAQCASLWAKRAYKAFWDRFRRFEIVPGFGYSGEVISVVSEYLRSRSIQLPLMLLHDGVRVLASEGSVLSCASPAEALTASGLLRALATSAGELGDSWENWFGTRDAVAEEAMRAGIDWLAEVYRVGSGSEWVLVWVG